MSAREKEILEIPPLSPGETSLLDMHSVLNVLNVLQGELTLLGIYLKEDDNLLAPGLVLCRQIHADLVNPSAALRHAVSVPSYRRVVKKLVAQELARHSQRAGMAEVQESVANIDSVFSVLEVRAREILARARRPGEWVAMTREELRGDFQDVFSAIERNSRGRFRIVYNIAQQRPADYYVDFAVEAERGRVLQLPFVFKDVMRDLMANARKYTEPGGTINAGLYESPDGLSFTVQDSGRGIPASELETVVHYGKRGSNVGQVRTMGGGFGLTKAFLVTKQFGGRFWIKSAEGAGTRVHIEIPRTAGEARAV